MSITPIIGFAVSLTASLLLVPLQICNDKNSEWAKFGWFALSLLLGVVADYFFLQLLLRSPQ